MLVPSYKPLDITLIRHDINKQYLREELGLSPSTLAKMSRGEPVAMTVLLRICEELDCAVEDVVEFVKVEDGKSDLLGK